MIGFRPVLYTQDAMKLIKNQIIDRNTTDTRAIIGLDLEKTFDNILHFYALGTISSLGLQKNFFDYTRSFLAGREATLKVGDLVSDSVKLGSKSTLQGLIIFPAVFNLAIIGLSIKLSEVARYSTTIYADDVTIWCTGGSDGHFEAALQNVIEVTGSRLIPN
ncbi:uncharacterized protein LOC142766050 [Rhipicephalus microplus]|uniref:uncharacterized protein LOC142766050 n=1 Tax=Rhipicephalus microplus TaxID=6941 RepID=UPI003F6D7242